jgi:hypothetical protein
MPILIIKFYFINIKNKLDIFKLLKNFVLLQT